jgi:hypothetical protein
MKQELWYIIVDGFVHANDAAVGNFYGYGSHLGEAIDRVLAAAEKVGFINPRVSEVSPAELDVNMQSQLMKLNPYVFHAPTKYFYPVSDFQRAFVLPCGVVYSATPSAQKADADPDLVATSFYSSDMPNAEGEYELDLVLSRAMLEDVFFMCVKLLYPINGLFLRLANWENRADDVWFASTADAEWICRLLKETSPNTMENGFMEIAVTASERSRRTTLLLNPHKTIQIFSKLKPVHDAFTQQLLKMGFRRSPELHSVDRGYSHMHYRPGLSFDRAGMEKWLANNRFEFLAFETAA